MKQRYLIEAVLCTEGIDIPPPASHMLRRIQRSVVELYELFMVEVSQRPSMFLGQANAEDQ